MSIAQAHLRVARPTNNIAALLAFYVDGLGFEHLGGFEAHEGFDGVMLGHAGAAYHLEFTFKAGHDAGRAPTQDNLLVFYVPDGAKHAAAVARMQGVGFAPVVSFNPYWDRCGTTFEDPDGYRIVLAAMGWETPLDLGGKIAQGE
jgi:catechol 2,3-dioxygenase-like lactoylglutathione lyase family enzyme